MSLTPEQLRETLATRAHELGLDAFGVAPIEPHLRRQYYLDWIQEGQHASMSWLERNNDRRLHPSAVLPGARSILVFGLNYHQPQPPRDFRIARYALGKDYHKILFKKLKQVCTLLREYGGEQKPYVDTGPVLERPIAAHTQLGWQAKNTLLVSRDYGVWLLLGEIFTTLELHPDTPSSDHCGSCTRCIDACPTDAITGPYQLDASRCLSYYSIEHHGPIPLTYRRAMGDRVFGCDDCLDVCPWNRFAKQTREARFQPVDLPALRDTLTWSEEDFRAHFAGTPVARLGLERWWRNAAVVLGNIGTTADLPALEALAADSTPLVAEHAQWAISEIRQRDS